MRTKRIWPDGHDVVSSATRRGLPDRLLQCPKVHGQPIWRSRGESPLGAFCPRGVPGKPASPDRPSLGAQRGAAWSRIGVTSAGAETERLARSRQPRGEAARKGRGCRTVATHEADPTATRCGNQEATPPPHLAPQVCGRN